MGVRWGCGAFGRVHNLAHTVPGYGIGGLDETEMVVRKVDVMYKCDRCGEEKVFHNASPEKRIHDLNNNGWRQLAMSSMTHEKGNLGNMCLVFDLCRLCYTDICAFIRMQGLTGDPSQVPEQAKLPNQPQPR